MNDEDKISVTLSNGSVVYGTKASVLETLRKSGVAVYYSESKQQYLDAETMPTNYLRNALAKLFVESLKGYLKRISDLDFSSFCSLISGHLDQDNQDLKDLIKVYNSKQDAKM